MKPFIARNIFQNNEVMIAVDNDDTKILNILFNFFTFLIVLIKQV